MFLGFIFSYIFVENINKMKFNPCLSVDCVLFGFDGRDLKVLLICKTELNNRTPAEKYPMKLPGRLIYENEELEIAANSILEEYTGLKCSSLRQFRVFGSLTRTHNPKDVEWLEEIVNLKIGRLITIAYIGLVYIDNHKYQPVNNQYKAQWVNLKDVPYLAFDHNQIVSEVITEMQNLIKNDMSVLFDLLPGKFTALQLRSLYEGLYSKSFDVRNFYKKIISTPYVVALDEYEKNVSHRAARYYKIDKKKLKDGVIK